MVSEDNIKYRAYGIDVFEENKLIKTVKDISLERASLERLIHKCNLLNVSLIHIDDVLEDFMMK